MLSTLDEDGNSANHAQTDNGGYPLHVDATGIPADTSSPVAAKKAPPSVQELLTMLQQGRKREVKLALRETAPGGGVGSVAARARVWSALCAQHRRGGALEGAFYLDMVAQVFGQRGSEDAAHPVAVLPPFADAARCPTYYLTRRGRGLADRVVAVLAYACPDITYSPALYPICALLLHYMDEEDAYHSMASLVASKDKMFITQTKLHYEVTWKTVMQLTKKHAKSASAHLQRHCSGGRVERIYMDWMWWILQNLPFNHLVRVVDCFLHEGIKVLYRVSMAILILFHKHSSVSGSEWAKELMSSSDPGMTLTKFCRHIPVSPVKLLRAAFGIRALSSAYINRVFLRTEMALKSRGTRQINRSRSSDNIPDSQSQVNIQMMSHTLTIRERMTEEAHKEMLFTLWSWLPVRITMYQPVLLYTTEEHGCSLTTFYVRVEQHEPTLMMIKTCNNEVFGAYCSSRWYERNLKDDRGNRQAYFGTGETFLFSLHPERAKYPWVGMEGDKGLGHGAELFMAADSKMITIGGGEGQAIWMDENIRFGKTDRCQTFNNPPLCPSGDFEIRVLEVYGFAGA